MKRLLLFPAIALLAACQGSPGTPSPDAPPPAMAGGSTVGNGMTKYSNTEMNIEFDYPESWSLESQGTRFFSLSNAKLVDEPQKASQIDFALLTDLEGKRFTSQAELLNYLELKWPGKVWKKSAMVKKQGYWTETGDQNSKEGSYYLLDENHNIIFISYLAFADSQGLEVIRNIVKSLSVDFEGPQILSLSFDRELAHPGETIKLQIVAEDELSDVDVSSVIDDSIAYPCSGGRGSAFGYKAKGPTNSDHKYDCAYPIRLTPKRVNANTYEVELRIAEFAPAGTIQLKALKIGDTKGNINQIFIEWSGRYYYAPAGHAQIPVAAFEIKTPPGFAPDTEDPELLDMYFEKSKLSKADPIQRLFLKIQDRSKIQAHALLKLTTNSSSLDCAKGGKMIKNLGNNLYAFEYDMSPCFGTDQPRLVYGEARHLVLFDEVGNPADTGSVRAAVFEMQK